jgi:hypothetical protein
MTHVEVRSEYGLGTVNPIFFTHVDSLSRSTSGMITWLECIVHQRGADIPDILTSVPHAWIPDAVQREVIAM